MIDTTKLVDASPWHPIKDAVDLKHLGKFGEELNECGSAVSRCIIQGVHECEPVTGKPNVQWLEDEIADVLAGIDLCIERFNLDVPRIKERQARKKLHLRSWHRMA
jgi:hypothetical protein